MDWFSLLFLLAAVLALLTGRAYFRGTVHRALDPRRYWSTVAGYVAIALTSIALVSGTTAAPLAWFTDFLTDAATRLARDLKDGAGRLQSSGATSRVVIHEMRRSPEGCAHGYRVQLSAASTLVVWCKGMDGLQTVSSHSTTSHLPQVDVPHTWIVDKAGGETLHVELTRTAGKPAVSRVY